MGVLNEFLERKEVGCGVVVHVAIRRVGRHGGKGLSAAEVAPARSIRIESMAVHGSKVPIIDLTFCRLIVQAAKCHTVQLCTGKNSLANGDAGEMAGRSDAFPDDPFPGAVGTEMDCL